ncbi:MAG TPA: hypothetical protein VHO84_06375 [Syntrophorhabdaceae bacterium]|nr:hypothetical protein [Syntrophorhabdaceae bacterium]
MNCLRRLEVFSLSPGGFKIATNKVVAALGRRPNVDNLGLEELGVPLDKRGIPPFDPCSMRIADLPVFIAGDASNRAPFMHEAADEGYVAGVNAFALHVTRYARRVPLAIVFSDPEIAMVGERFSNLIQDRTAIGEVDFGTQGRAIAAGTANGVLRVYGDKNTGRLLGAEMCAPDGEHLAHLLALAIERKLTAQELLKMPYYHPVIEEGLRTALRDLVKQLSSKAAPDLAACEGFENSALGL